MKTVTTIIDGHEMEVPEHLMAADEATRTLDANDALVMALRQIATYDPTKLDAATLGNIARAALAKAGVKS